MFTLSNNLITIKLIHKTISNKKNSCNNAHILRHNANFKIKQKVTTKNTENNDLKNQILWNIVLKTCFLNKLQMFVKNTQEF